MPERIGGGVTKLLEKKNASIRGLTADVTELEAKLKRAIWTLKQFATLETIVAPDGRKWPLGHLARACLKELGVEK